MWRSLTRRCALITSRKTWDGRVNSLLQKLKEAEFVAVDLELTGLHLKNERFVGVDRCYQAHCEGAKTFLPVQIGLCAAKRAQNDPYKWILTPASVYIYPRNEETVFSINVGALNFLRANDFDFNEWASEGVGFLRPEEEKEMTSSIDSRMAEVEWRRQQTERGEEERNDQIMLCPDQLVGMEDDERAAVEALKAQIQEWSESGSEGSLELVVERAYTRLLLHSVIASDFPSFHSHSSRREHDGVRTVCVYRSRAEVFGEQKRALEREREKVEQMVGVRRLLDAVTEGGGFLVGHNCFYDFLHLYQTFYGDLPPRVQDFKQRWLDRFPHTLDTKYLAEAHELLSALDPPGTLKALCDFMLAVSETTPSPSTAPLSSQGHSLSSQDLKEQNRNEFRSQQPDSQEDTLSRHSHQPHSNQAGGGREQSRSLRVCIENIPGTNWTLPPNCKAIAEGGLDPGGGVRGLEKGGGEFLVDTDRAHEAGYDAMMTSLVVLLQLDFILAQKKLDWRQIEFISKGSRGQGQTGGKQGHAHVGGAKARSVSDLLPLMVNRVRLVKSQPSFLNLSGRDESDLSRHFLMSGFPASWRKWEVLKVWSPVWVTVSWIEDGSCWVIAKNDEDVRAVRQIYDAMQTKPFKLQTYEEYKQNDRDASLGGST
uniref:Poly(A)-specific ribonuclease RNA-binding domain-containing protein n=1 Tax=Chromera velia CCMP2878 TaxID=1169474 RepID=A0A0G4I3Z5_9ALVE|mmetsp:Transcript_45841/g.90287  ORF Transcript_45841/g.90287 Transcript_45841/m.90287 type:complete len:653 (+) Transcript_45841:172-2130(+)|eukprot:Cvel_10720.t1-p1 / transcript=Cvel_10720.t1 / gene=Cvel_10720 / organism=Chromera_velia_CCMP2878 / gene_product=Poly(A)-specific ribonuclease PARN, putative / transcript_product=Poly(A)-specific ribonuclease PARN, putative / location=Cvel_scaffold652:51908-60884(+) / protein_length=652 / sequence_SO=supercontig / SO=protein_coding / is_pseudo=false